MKMEEKRKQRSGRTKNKHRTDREGYTEVKKKERGV
jgi:hypothetical protein